jgi:hypothetical protein
VISSAREVVMSAQHIAGLPVEEILLAAIAAAAPLIALIGWEISSRIKRLTAFVRRRRPASGERVVTPPAEPP